jgi:hypothetical protein
MPIDPRCGACGRPVKVVELDGEPIELDPIPSLDGRFRLSAEDRSKAERIDRPGHQGYRPHAETCPAA